MSPTNDVKITEVELYQSVTEKEQAIQELMLQLAAEDQVYQQAKLQERTIANQLNDIRYAKMVAKERANNLQKRIDALKNSQTDGFNIIYELDQLLTILAKLGFCNPTIVQLPNQRNYQCYTLTILTNGTPTTVHLYTQNYLYADFCVLCCYATKDRKKIVNILNKALVVNVDFKGAIVIYGTK